MGNCTSSGAPARAFLPLVARVIFPDGRLQEFQQPIKAGEVLLENPGHFLCCSESMQVDSPMPHVYDKEELQLDQIYFLMPLASSHRPLSLPDLCALAVKASSALTTSAIGGRCSNVTSVPQHPCRPVLNASIGPSVIKS